MGLFNLFKSKKTTGDYSPKGKSGYFPKAQNSLGIRTEEELKARAKIILNDNDGIVSSNEHEKEKMNAYKREKAMSYMDLSEPINTDVSSLGFFGYKNGSNNIVTLIDLNQINIDNIKEIAIKQSFFPTESTPHFIGKIGINDGSLHPDGSVNQFGIDISYDMSSLGIRVTLYELIVFPECKVYFIDEKFKGKDEFQCRKLYEFKNSFAVRTNFLCEVEAYIHSLSDYSIFSLDSKEAANLYQRCFNIDGRATSTEAKDFWLRRRKYSPTPTSPEEWMQFTM